MPPPMQAAPPPSDELDLSAGIVATPPKQPPPPQAPDPDEEDDKPFNWGQFASDVGSGFKTSLNQTGETAMKVLGATGIPQAINRPGWERSQAQTHDIARAPLDTGGKMTGAALENILEFVAGDEALKGVSTAMKVSQLASVERALQKSPILTRMLGNAVRGQAVGTTQAAAHGATGGEAVAQGAATAVGGAALEGLFQGGKNFLRLIRPTTTDVLGEDLLTLASQKKGASPVAENIADIRSTPEVARVQQEGGQRAIVNRAQRVAASELHKLNAARAARWMEGEGVMNLAPEAAPEVAGPGRQLPSGQQQLPASTPNQQQFYRGIDRPYDPNELGSGHFTTNKRLASNYAMGSKANVLEGSLDIKNPMPWQEAQTLTPSEIVAAGYDGALDITPDGKIHRAIITSPEQFSATPKGVGPYEGDFPTRPGQGVGAYEGDFPPQPGQEATSPAGKKVKFVEEKPPNFEPIDVHSEIQGVRSFRDAAELVRKHAAPVFDRFDKATGGEYSRIRLIRDAAYRAEDYNGVRQAEKEIDALLNHTRGKIDRTDYRTVRTAWRSSRVLDAVHDAVDRAINIGDESLAEDAGVWRGVNGGTLMRGINRLVRDYGRTELEDIIGKDGLTGLTRFATLTQTPQRAALYGEKAAEVAHAAMADKRTAFIPAHIDWARRALFRQIAINPRAGQIMDYAIKHNLSGELTYKILANVLGNTNRNQQRIDDEEVVSEDDERGVKPVTLPVLRNSQ